MALIVETGAVVAGANSYVSLADIATYHSARGNSSWTGADPVKEAAILRAMAFIEARHWKGSKTAYTNPLAWPRADVQDRDGFDVPEDTVPAGVVQALCEAALRELTTPGTLAPDLYRGGRVMSESVDVISTSFESGAPAGTVFFAVNNALRGLVRSSACVEVGRG